MESRLLPTYTLFLVLTLGVLVLIKIFDISYPLTITSTTKSTEMAVVGEGKVEVVPDTASIEAGITVANAQSVESAQKSISEVNNKIIESMRKLGIQSADIKTSNYSINPAYEGGVEKISGYSGNAIISIRIKNLTLVSKVIEEATKAGANQIYGARFNIDKPEKYREEARGKAIDNAKEQARKLASSLGIRLGKIVNIVESSPSEPYPLSRGLSAIEGRGGVSAQIEPGSETVTSIVTLYFEKR